MKSLTYFRSKPNFSSPVWLTLSAVLLINTPSAKGNPVVDGLNASDSTTCVNDGHTEEITIGGGGIRWPRWPRWPFVFPQIIGGGGGGGTGGNTVFVSTGSSSNNCSFVHNGRMDYHAWGYDFKLPSGAAGCSTCSSSSNFGTALQPIEVKRYLRSRMDSHGVNSFGRVSALVGYDVSVSWPENHLESIMSFHEPGRFNSICQMNWQSDRMTWAPIGAAEAAFGLTLFDATGNPITAFASRELAHTGVFLKADGSTIHFEIIRKSNKAYGRPVAFADRVGNIINVEYVDAQPTYGTDVSTVSEYFRRTKITDNYGRELLFEYSLEGNSYLVSKITHPDGQFTTYSYKNLSFYGKVIDEVNHPDGTTTTNNWNHNLVTGFWELEMFEATAEPGKRRKTVYISTNKGADENGNMISTVAGLTRAVLNGEGELSYGNRVLANNDRLVYAGGNKAFIVKINGAVRGLGEYNEISGGESLQNNFFTVDINSLTQTQKFDRTNGNNWREVETTDALDRQNLIAARNPISLSPSQVEMADGTSETIIHNPFDTPALYTDRLNRVAKNEFDLLGNATKATRSFGTADASTEEYIYNAQGLVIEHRDPLYDSDFPELHNTRYEYNANNFPIKVIHSADFAGGTRPETIYTWDSTGRLASTTDPIGRLVTYGYDARSRLVTTTYADSSTETVEYGTGILANLIVKTTDRNGFETTYHYDDADRAIQTTTASNTSEPSIEICTYLAGTMIKETCIINGSKTTYEFDHQNRVIGTTLHPTEDNSLTSSTELDVLDRTRSTTDFYGRKTYYLYDQNDNVTRTVTETVADALAAPAIVAGSSQTSAQKNYTLTDKDSNLLETDPDSENRTHEVTYTDPRDLFLKNLTRDLSPNAPYLITDTIYDAEGQTLISTDARGINTWMEYDALGRNTLTIMAVGTPEEIRSANSYDDNSNLVETKSPRFFSESINTIDQFTYNGRNLKASHTTAPNTPEAATQSWTYYLDGRNDEHTDFRGNTSKQIWHTCCGRLQASIDRDGESTTIYNTDYKGQPIHSATVSQNPGGNWHNPVDADTLREITSRFDGRGRTTHNTVWLNPLGSIFASCCGGAGDGILPIAGLEGVPATDGLTTSYQYDDDLTDGVGIDANYATQLAQLNITFGPKATGSAMAVTNPAGETSVQIQDGIGRTVMTINPEGHTATIEYDEITLTGDLTSPSASIPVPAGLLATVATDANGNTTQSYTDGAGRTLAAEDAEGNLSAAAYDGNSNTLITADPNGLGQTCIYDALNRKTECADKQEQVENTSRTTQYNAASQVITSTDAEGEITSNAYDERNRLINSTDPNNITTSYEYDANNNLITLTDGKNATRSWTYDLRNLKITKSMPDANDALSYSHDALGRIKQETRQDNSTVELTYDLAGRMTEREYSDSTTDEFTYDEASRLSSATKGRHAITVNRTYADDGAMTSESYVLDGRTYTLVRSYDNGNRVSSQTFADGKVMTWTHDGSNLVTQAHYDGDLVLSQAHDPADRLTNQTFGNGLVRNITHNRQDNLRTADTVFDGNNPIDELNFNYSYAADKNVLSESQTNGILENLSFTAAYDPGNRVISYNRQEAYLGARENQSWNYDAAGNWNSTTIDGNTENRSHSDSDELQSIAGDNFTHDPRGNQLTDNRGNEYTWDLDNRIIEADGTGFSNIEYRYDALGRRIVREQGSNKEVLLWWNNTEQAQHKHQAGQTTIQNDLQADPSEATLNTIFARALEGNKQDIQYFHKNYLDHVMAVSDDNGDILEHYRYTAFGEPEIYTPTGNKLTSSAIDNDILWNVRRYESATGLYTYKYRDYDTSTGRWPSRDPIEERGGVNLYGFIVNNPISRWDNLGHAPGDVHEEKQDAVESAALYLSTQTALSRENGFGEWLSSVSEIDIPNKDLFGVNFHGFTDGFGEQWVVFGVEYGVQIFEFCDESTGNIFYEEGSEAKGSLPSTAQLAMSKYGSVKLGDSVSQKEGSKSVVHMHTHNLGLRTPHETYHILALGPSIADGITRLDDGDNYIVHDGGRLQEF